MAVVWVKMNSETLVRSANLKDADFGWATLAGADASYCDMTSSNLGAAKASWARFNNAKLVGANLEAGQFEYAMFVGSDLSSARFSKETQIEGTNFCSANVSGTLIEMAVETKRQPDWVRFLTHD